MKGLFTLCVKEVLCPDKGGTDATFCERCPGERENVLAFS